MSRHPLLKIYDKVTDAVFPEKVLHTMDDAKREMEKKELDPSRVRYKTKPGYVWNPLKKYPKNMVCFCGSRIKFKSCHMRKLPEVVTKEESIKLLKYLDQVELFNLAKASGMSVDEYKKYQDE